MAFFSSPQKEGGGVSKNGPKTREYITFFKSLKAYFGTLMIPNFLTSLFNLFILPSGLGAVGSARMARIAVCGRHTFSSDYFEAIKENWKLALASGIINNFIFLFSLFSLYSMNRAKKIEVIPMAICIVAIVIISFVKYYTSAIMLTFNVNIIQLYKNALLLSFLGIWRNLLNAAEHIIAYAVILLPLTIDLYVGAGISICLYLVFIPTFRNFSTQYNIFPVMYKYMIEPFMKENPGKGEKTLRELGLIQENEESIMKDTVQ